MYGTEQKPLNEIKPRTLVIHRGRTWTASANTGGYLYLNSLYEKKRINDPLIEVVLNNSGEPEVVQ